jgi:hypothetical protein
MFATGFAVAMSAISLDKVRSAMNLPEQPRRKIARAVESAFAESGQPWSSAFPEFGATQPFRLKDSTSTDLPSGLADLYASIVLYLYDNHGGDEWLKRYYASLALLPPSPVKVTGGAEGQILNMLIASNLAAGEDLSPLFRERWRAPLPPATFAELEKIDWTTAEATGIYDRLSLESLPDTLRTTRVKYANRLTEASQELVDPNFETPHKKAWKSIATGVAYTRDDVERGRGGEMGDSVVVDGSSSRSGWKQLVPLEPGETYIVSGWVKTENLVPVENSNSQGAFIQSSPEFRSKAVKGSSDWEYLAFPVIAPDGGETPIELVVAESLGRAFFARIRISKISP